MLPPFITKEWLADHPDHIFVYGDNDQRVGKGGAAKLRDCPNSYGFITKKKPTHSDESFYTPSDYSKKFQTELQKLKSFIRGNPSKTFIISKIGSGLANRYHIWEEVIRPGLEDLKEFPNVIFMFGQKG